jgi:hypothetical protein
MTGLSLNAHVLGQERSISARLQSGVWMLATDAEPRRVSSLAQALYVARDFIGPFLGQARKDQLWGLVVRVDGFSALYGRPNPAAGVTVGIGAPADPNSPFMRIYRRWRASDSPRSALENALDIIREAARQRHSAAA